MDIKPKCRTDAARAADKRYRIKILLEKRFYCAKHDYTFDSMRHLRTHLAGKKHNPELYIRYHCESCNFHTKIKCLLAKHQQTKRHIQNFLNKNAAY